MYEVVSREEADVGRKNQWYVLESLREVQLWEGMAHECTTLVLIWEDWWHLETDMRFRLGENATASYFWPLPSDARPIWPMHCGRCGATLPDASQGKTPTKSALPGVKSPLETDAAQLRLL